MKTRLRAPALIAVETAGQTAALPAIVALVSLFELAIADRKYGLFTGGFGQPFAVDSSAELTPFAAGYLTSQIAVAVIVWKAIAWLNRRNGVWPALFHFTIAYGGAFLALLTLRYQLHSYFSDAMSFALIKQLGGGSALDALLFGKNEIAFAGAGLALFGLGWWLVWRLLKRRFPPAPAKRASRPSWRGIGLIWLVWLGLLALLPRNASDAAYGMGRTLGWSTAMQLASAATDFDRDGYGLFGQRADSHPFDAARHPLALDVPGNGIDEDGYGGDLSLVPIPVPVPQTAVPPSGPNVIMVVFESTRSDVLGKRIDGKPVAPNLEQLAASGAAIAPSYSHVAFTTASLKSIFSGRLVPHPGDPSLFTDLKAAGYRISVFSGQPEDFGDISATVAMRSSADTFVDAERLKDKRAFSFAAQGSLLVDEGVLLEEFDHTLGKPDDWSQPQFVYLNFQSPHFPYDHPGVARRFADPPLARGAITAANRAGVERTYWNAVANADARLGELVARLKQLGVWENTILMVSGDHGEALFEDGFLGHGHVINQSQFATFLVTNRALPALRPPIAISDYRAIVLGLLTGKPALQPQPAPFMHIGELDTPSVIGLAGTAFGIVSLKSRCSTISLPKNTWSSPAR